MEIQNSEVPKKRKRGMLLTKAVAYVAVGMMIFGLGISVGNDSLTLGAQQKSVNKDLPANLDYQEVEQLYDKLRQNFDGDLTTEKLLEGLKQGLAGASGDTYTEYLNAKEARSFDEDLNGSFSGIGAELSKEEKEIIIVAPIAGFPAAKAGLQPRDVIAEINGESAYDLTVTEAVNKIRGPVGTKVKLKVVRDAREELDFEITRAQITIPSVESEILDGNIGYLKISRFANDTDALALKAAEHFKQTNVNGVILDVRNNPGGLLDASVSLAGLWLPKGTTVLEEKRGGVTIESLKSNGPAMLKGIPTVVLINDGSASASEIVAGALKDHKAATLVGTKTFGKGSVQQLQQLSDGGVLKVTIARWYTPGGKNIDKEGIQPDKKVDQTADDMKNNKDPQRDAAVDALRK